MTQAGLREKQEPAAEQRPGVPFDEATFESLWRSRRILVLGSSGAGKSHLSRNLSRILGIEAIHLDDHFWQPDGHPCGDREWRETVKELAARESWIMDGTYERSLDLRMPRADAIILLECAAELCLERVLRRDGWITRPTEKNHSGGSSYQIDRSHVQYVTQYAWATRPIVLDHVERYGRDKTVVAVHAPEGVDSFLFGVASRPPARWKRA
jgi:adenylate kinase family enzyme